MPALKRTALPEGFSSLAPVRNAHGERNDCTVVAVALTTGLPYDVVHKAMAEAGRRTGKGCYPEVWQNAMAPLGFKLRKWTSTEMVGMIMSYPKKGIAGITTHQPRRFAKQWKGTGKLILWSRGHVSACIDGTVQDWAINKSKQVHTIYEVLPIEA